MNEMVTMAAGTQADGLGAPASAWEQLQSAFQQALWSGDFIDAEVVATKAFRHGESMMPVYEQLMAPALHRVGELWSLGEMTVADEHLATEATLRAMAGVFGLADSRALADGTPRCIVTATAEGEHHGVGLRMAADALELAGHDVVHCGVDTPVGDLVSLAESAGADAVAISFTMASSGDGLASAAARIWERLPGLPLLVGGQGLPTRLPAGPVHRIGGLEELVAIVDGLPHRATFPALAPRRHDPLAPKRLSDFRSDLSARPPVGPPAPGPAHLQTIFEATDDAMATVDIEGTVTAWNGVAETVYGHSAAEAIGRRLAGLVGPEERARMVRRRLREALAGRTVEVRERHSLPRDGSERTILQRLAPIRVGAEVVGVAMIARDVTEHDRPGGPESVDTRHMWYQRIEHALAEDRFVLASQPIIDLTTEEVDHCELLLRLRMGGQIVMPGDFIPPAERFGLIRSIDRWVVENGIELSRSYPVAVNLSGASLTDPELLKAIEAALDRVGTNPDHVTFEITETAAAENIDAAAALVCRLRELGCRVALDDFGTGFGSFTYLSRLPVTELKIDNQFARGVRTGVAELRVIDAVVSVGEAFGIRTVAEGVEDEETLEIMKNAGIALGQGWLFGKPQLIDQGPGAMTAPGARRRARPAG